MTFSAMTRMACAALVSLGVAACSGKAGDASGAGPGPGDGNGSGVNVKVHPASATVAADAEFAFSSIVTGTLDLSVSWTAEPAGCGTVGTTGLYTAPSTGKTCTVRARSRADTTRSGTALVVVTGHGTINPSFRVTLTPQAGVTGVQRINFAVPLPAGTLGSADQIRVSLAGGAELATARRALASWPDGSLRSVQLQVDVDVGTTSALDVQVGSAAGAGSLTRAAVEDTLVTADGLSGPRVWVRLPSAWLAPSGVVGPALPEADTPSTLNAWLTQCDYAAWGASAFWPNQATASYWLFDRPTALYLGYAITGDLSPLQSAYREVSLYRDGITGTGSATRIGVPGVAEDLKYHYSQGMAIHYLLTGDDRFREAAENVAVRVHDMWTDPGYAGGSDFWTERHAGFALLAYEWAAAVSDDRASTFTGWSDVAVPAYLAMQEDATHAWETDARCFAHSAAAHGESFGYWGCSPWMSAILADGLETYARRVGGTRAADARNGLVRLGKMIARHGRETTGYGKPYYWMGAGVNQDEVDDYQEHWGESAYVVGLAWYWSGRSDAALHTAAMDLVNGFATLGEVGQVRSFNWQCRSAPMAPWFLKP
jgi:hypothetical protein